LESAPWRRSAPAAQAHDEMQRAVVLDVVVRQRPVVVELLASEDEALLLIVVYLLSTEE